jgi:hypothetical protein
MQMNPHNPCARIRDGLGVAGAAKAMNASCNKQFRLRDVEIRLKDVP